MGIRGRSLQVGDSATTDYDDRGPAHVRIVERSDDRRHGHSQSGIMFRVHPTLRLGNAGSWYDADWFEPENAEPCSHPGCGTPTQPGPCAFDACPRREK
jgi:hypothetical protein